MTETRKLAAILVADVVGYGRPAEVDEDPTLSRLRGFAATSSTPPSPRIMAASSSAPATAASWSFGACSTRPAGVI